MGILDDLAAQHTSTPAPTGGGILDQLAAKHAPEHHQQSMWDRLRGVTRKDVGKFLRPTLEGLGAAGGAIVGSGAAPVVGTVAGAGLGFAIGKKASDLIEGTPEAPMAPHLTNTLNPFAKGTALADVATGAQYEMGGQVAGKVIGAGLGAAKRSLNMGIPGSPRRNMFKAAQEFGNAENGVTGDWKTTDPGFAERGKPTDQTRMSVANEQRVARDKALLTRLNKKRVAAGLKPIQLSKGQEQGGPMLALEQSQRLKYKNKPATAGTPTFDERVLTNNALMADSARTDMEAAVPAGRPVPSVEDASTTGQRTVDAIRKSEAAVKPEVTRLFNHPSFKYEMPRVEFDDAMGDVTASNLSPQSKAAVKRIKDFAAGADNTSAGLKSIKEAIDGEIGLAGAAGNKPTARVMGLLKQGVMGSFESMGKAAAEGDVALHNGKIIYPSRIATQVAGLDQRIAAETERLAAPQPGTMDIQAAQKALSAKGAPTQEWMKQVNESQAQVEAKVRKAWAKNMGDTPIPGANKPVDRSTLERLTAERDALSTTLKEAKPAEDVANAYSSALKYTRTEQKDRFARDTIKGILKPGDQYGGLATPVESIPDKVWTPSGAREFVRSQMPFKAAGAEVDAATRVAAGRKAAGELAFPTMVRKFASSGAIDPKTGVLQIPAALKFARDNAPVLRELGLTGEMDNIIKGQIRGAIKHNLSLRGVDILGNPTMSARLAKRFIKEQFGPAVTRYFPNAGRAMDDWARTLEIAERSNVKATLQGPNTAEKLDLMAIGDKVSMFGAVLGKVGWLMNSIKGAVSTLAKQPMELSRAAKDQIIQNGLMDDDVAKALRDIYRAKKFTDISQTTANTLKQLMVQLQIDPASGAAAAGTAVQGAANVLGGAANIVGSLVSPQQGATNP